MTETRTETKLKEFLRANGLRASFVSKAIGTSSRTMTAYLTGEYDPPEPMRYAIHAFLEKHLNRSIEPSELWR